MIFCSTWRAESGIFYFIIIIILFVRIFIQEQVKNTTTHLRIGRSVNGFEKLRIFVMIWLVL